MHQVHSIKMYMLQLCYIHILYSTYSSFSHDMNVHRIILINSTLIFLVDNKSGGTQKITTVDLIHNLTFKRSDPPESNI